MRLAEGRLQRRQLASAGEAFDGVELGAVDLDGEEEARPHRDAVEPHGAGPADAMLATHVGAGEAERVPDEVGEQQPRLDELTATPAVDGDGDLDHVAAPAALRQARRTARSVRTPVMWRRYSDEACIVPTGSTAARAASAAVRAASPSMARPTSGSVDERRPVCHRAEAQPRLRDPAVLDAKRARGHAEREVPVALRELLERVAPTARQRSARSCA